MRTVKEFVISVFLPVLFGKYSMVQSKLPGNHLYWFLSLRMWTRCGYRTLFGMTFSPQEIQKPQSLSWACTVSPLILRRPATLRGNHNCPVWAIWERVTLQFFMYFPYFLILDFSFSDILNKLFLLLERIYRSPIRSASADSYRSDLQCLVIFKQQFWMGMWHLQGCYCLLLLWYLRNPKESTFLTHWRNGLLVPRPWMRKQSLEPSVA